MRIALVPADVRGADRAELIDFLTRQTWPFHVRARPTREQVAAAVTAGRYDGAEHRSLWVVGDARPIGVAVLDDVTDDTPLFDLRLDAAHRGRGLAAPVLRALTAHVFETLPASRRLEGQTRQDNVAMRRALLRAGFVQEAWYRDGWPVEGGAPMASAGYAVLRRDWESGSTTPVPWGDLAR